MSDLIKIDSIEERIYFIRGVKVILDRDLAELYRVETKKLKQQVRRNIERFPSDFMFVLTKDEFNNWRSQFVTSNSDRIGLRYPPMVFTEQGVAMLSSVLRSKRAVRVNIEIMRTFVKLRHIIVDNAELKRKLEELRKETDDRFLIVFSVLDKLVSEEEESKRKIGFIKNALDDTSH